jgi:hypothetical protein
MWHLLQAQKLKMNDERINLNLNPKQKIKESR